mgnify:CR=1 FL=1
MGIYGRLYDAINFTEMTKKDYELIAGVFKDFLKKSTLSNSRFITEIITEGLANKLAKQDPKFQRQKFLSSCGIDWSVGA